MWRLITQHTNVNWILVCWHNTSQNSVIRSMSIVLSCSPWSWTSSRSEFRTRVTSFGSCYSFNVFLIVRLAQWRFTMYRVFHNRMLLASTPWSVTTEWTLSILTGPIFNSSNNMWTYFHAVQIILFPLRKSIIRWLLYIVDRRILSIDTCPSWAVLARSGAIGLAAKLIDSSLWIKLNSHISFDTFE